MPLRYTDLPCDKDTDGHLIFITLRASYGAVYCNQSRLWVGVFVCVWVCYHDNSKFHASILTKLGL